MRVLIATDAWRPQVNGVVRTLNALEHSARRLGAEIGFLTPDGFPSIPVPTYPGLRLALPGRREVARRIEAFRPDIIHVATEGTIGHRARAYCVDRGHPFTTSFHTKFPEYIAARFAVPERWSYGALRRFHAGAGVTMAATASLMRELGSRGFGRLALWARGVDTELFRPEPRADLGLPRPISSVPGTAPLSPPILPRPTCSSSRAAPTHSASCSWKRWPAACRSPPFPSPARATSSGAARSACWTRISGLPAAPLSSCRVRRAARSRSITRGSAAHGSFSAISTA